MRVEQEIASNTNDVKSMKRFYNVQEAAHYLGISKAAVYKYVEFGMISYRRLISIPKKEKHKVVPHGRIVFEVTASDCFMDNYSEKREAHFNIRNKEKSLDNVN